MKLFFAFALLALLVVSGCVNTGAPMPLPRNENGNFVLYVSNQSFAIDPVDIKIYIDGQLAVNQNFLVDDQHKWSKFQFSLAKGTHKIYAESLKGETSLEQEFEILDKHWAVIDYWYYPEGVSGASPTPKHFSFDIKDEPIYFE